MRRALVICVLAAAGCGSSEASSSSGGTTGATSATGSATTTASTSSSSGAGGWGGAGGTGSTAAAGAGQGGGGGSPDVIDPATIEGKLLMGYQGWFACPNDGAPPDRWVHWFKNQTPDGANAGFDLWPDLSELDPDELFPTQMTYADQTNAALYSAYTAKTVVRHFRWMKDNGLDGVFLQRFSSELKDPAFFDLRNRVAENVRAGAEMHGRTFAIMYDISGQSESTLVTDLENDWSFLVDTLKLTESPQYLHEGGKPVLAVWGLGFSDRPGTPAQAAELIDYFKSSAAPQYRVTLMGGVPTYWRTLDNDSKTDPAWADIYRSFDILSPWAVGRFGDDAGADNFKTSKIVPDLVETNAAGIKYMPVVFPGFSWHNLTGSVPNQIPRRGGTFYWRQVYNALSAGSTMIYGAMFDEVDEGTAMFKIAPTSAELPTSGTFVPLDVDGMALPSDWYLQVAGEATRMVRGQIALTPTLPITP